MRFPPLTPVVKVWLATTLAAMIGIMVSENFLEVGVVQKLVLTAELGVHTAWQLVTYPLAQSPTSEGLTGYLISSVFFWLVVAPYELQWGRRMLIQLLVAITFGAALFAIPFGLFLGGGVFGFGPHVLGVIAAYAWAIRHRGQLSFFGVLPMKAVHLIGLCVFLSLLQFLARPNVMGFAADLGAVGVGVFFMWRLEQPKTPKKGGQPKKKSSSHLQVIDGGKHWLN